MKSVSIVIPCYNYAEYVRRAIESALAQCWPLVEVVVIDDGSTDDSASVIAGFGERIRAVRQANAGHVAAFNHGFAISTGEIVIFLDADDLLHPGAARAAAEAWRPTTAKLQYNLDLIDGDGASLGRQCCAFPQGYDTAAIHSEFARCNTYMWPVCTGNAYGRAFLGKVMPLTVRMAPDGFLNTVAPLFGEVLTQSASLGSYRVHQANQSYHGAGTTGVEQRFVKQIALRRSEERALREAAIRQDVRLAPVDLLDHELVFVNYRMMVKKLRQPYDGSQTDTVCKLWLRAVAFLRQRPMSTGFRVQNLLWISVLALAPSWLARQLVLLRFNRDSLFKPVRKARSQLRKLMHRTP
ncbi:MAG: hypothetical protein JWP29_1391 [Rhodoferax sp.]|nr:hypothetical protein [Rhodoferax sp.]